MLDLILKFLLWPVFALMNFFGAWSLRKSEAKDEELAKTPLPPQSLQVKSLKAEETIAFGDILCDCYELTGSFTLNDIEAFIREHRSKHSEHKLFATLDDFDQACYTFGHACGSRLKEGELDILIDAENNRDVLTFEVRANNFKNHLSGVPFEDILGKRYWQTASDLTPSVKTHNWPHRETKAYVQIVPVNSTAEALIAFPNGYFGGDYSPFENYRLAEALDRDFGFEVFGIGASYIGFMRNKPINGDDLDRLVLWLACLFRHEDTEQLKAHIRYELEDKNTFYLCYAER